MTAPRVLREQGPWRLVTTGAAIYLEQRAFTSRDDRALWEPATSWSLVRLDNRPKDHAAVMGMPWANRDEIAEAIPPAYTEFIGRQLIAAIRSERSERVS